MKLSYVTVGLTISLCFSSIAAGDTTATPSLCKADEKVVFSCVMKKPSGKILSVCSSKTLTATAGFLVYRFGTTEKTELSFPKSLERTQKAFTFSRYTRPMTTYTRLRFSGADGTSYSVYDDDSDGQEAAGVRVNSPGKASSEVDLPCSSSRTGALMPLEESIPNVPFDN